MKICLVLLALLVAVAFGHNKDGASYSAKKAAKLSLKDNLFEKIHNIKDKIHAKISSKKATKAAKKAQKLAGIKGFEKGAQPAADCSTVYDEVWEEQCGTKYEPSCRMEMQPHCTSIQAKECSPEAQTRCSLVFEDKCKTISIPKCTIDWEKRCTSTPDCTTIEAKSCTEVEKDVCVTHMDKTCSTSMVNVCRKIAVRENAPEDDTVERTGLKASIKAKAAAHKAHKAGLKASIKAKIAAHKAQKKGYTPVDDTVERTGMKASIKAKAAAHKAQKKGEQGRLHKRDAEAPQVEEFVEVEEREMAQEPFAALVDETETNDSNNSLSRVPRHIDLDGKLCWDVSTYLPVTFDKQPSEKCMPRLVTKKKKHKEEVCEDVTETKCDVVGYTECTRTEVPKDYKSQEYEYSYFQSKKCTPFTVEVPHWKESFKCEDKSRQNCVTKWEMLPDGTKVWTGNDDCKTVTWKECKKVPYKSVFQKDMVKCTDSTEIPYFNCKKITKAIDTTVVKCKPKSTVKCEPHTVKKCKDVEWEDSYQDVDNMCEPSMCWIPKQEKSHNKRCLLDDSYDGTSIIPDSVHKHEHSESTETKSDVEDGLEILDAEQLDHEEAVDLERTTRSLKGDTAGDQTANLAPKSSHLTAKETFKAGIKAAKDQYHEAKAQFKATTKALIHAKFNKGSKASKGGLKGHHVKAAVPTIRVRYEKSCTDEPRKTCTQTPRQECHKEVVPLCKTEPRETCVPKEKCKSWPKKNCGMIHKEACLPFPTKKCTEISTPVCRIVPRQECTEKKHEICETVPTKDCKKVLVKKPRTVCISRPSTRTIEDW